MCAESTIYSCKKEVFTTQKKSFQEFPLQTMQWVNVNLLIYTNGKERSHQNQAVIIYKGEIEEGTNLPK